MAAPFLTPIDMNKLEIQNLRLHVLASAPGSPVTGQIYYDSGTSKAYYWNGAWIDMTGGAVSFGGTAELADVDAAAEAAGSSGLVARADHKHALSVAAPASSAPGDSQTAGTANSAARSDHKHAREAFAGTTDLADVDAAAEAAGTAATIARGDHKHAAAVAAPSGSAVGDAQAAGSSNSLSRADHVHAREAFGAVTSQTSFGAASGNGSATTIARSDHTHGTPTHNTAAHSAVSITGLAAPTADVAWGSFKITSLADPASAQDAATKNYVDNAVQGLDAKASVRAATTVAGTLASSFENGDAIDGVTLATGDRILIKNQATAGENGIYVVNASGAPTRATDMNTWAEVISAFVWVEEGTVNADTGWVANANAGGTLGTTDMGWVQFSGAAQITAGAGLTKTGNTIDVGAGTGISVAADTVAIDTAVVVRKYALTIGDGAATSYNVDHSLGTLDVIVQVVRVSDGATVFVDVTRTTTNRVVVAFATAPASNTYRVLVHA